MNTLKLGEHFICDLSGCDRELLLDAERASELFTRAVDESGLTIVNKGFYKFNPHWVYLFFVTG